MPGQRLLHLTSHCVLGDSRVGGSEPLTSTRLAEFTTQSFVLLTDVCRGLGLLPLRTKHQHLAEFFSSRYLPHICPIIIDFVFFRIAEVLLWRIVPIASDTVLKTHIFVEDLRSHCYRFFPQLFVNISCCSLSHSL